LEVLAFCSLPLLLEGLWQAGATRIRKGKEKEREGGLLTDEHVKRPIPDQVGQRELAVATRADLASCNALFNALLAEPVAALRCSKGRW
jgi:hypothetical protein